MSNRSILIVDDEEGIRNSLKETLVLEGYSISLSEDGIDALAKFKEFSPSLVILDLMIPGIDGIELCRKFRELNPACAILMLTARCSEVDKVVGLEIGADDYMTKPFMPRELVARIKAIFRRLGDVTSSGSATLNLKDSLEIEKVEIGDIALDFKLYRAEKGGQEISMSAKEFELLKFLIEHQEQPITRDKLLDEVWGYDHYPTTRTVDTFISRLRNKIENEPSNPKYILTVHGVGYKFVNEKTRH